MKKPLEISPPLRRQWVELKLLGPVCRATFHNQLTKIERLIVDLYKERQLDRRR